MFSQKTWRVLEWFGVACFSFSTLIMLNKHVAAFAVTPWILFIVGNIIWIGSTFRRDYPMFSLCLFYFTLDCLITISRYYPHFFDLIQPILTLLDTLP
jgi:hypothetical protein